MSETLENFDSFIGGSLEQNLELVKMMHPKASADERRKELNQIILRGGLFWSKRKKSIIAGKLSDANRLNFQTFKKRLRLTLKKSLN